MIEPKECNYQIPLPSKDSFEALDTHGKLGILFDFMCVALVNQKEVVDTIKKNRGVDIKVAAGAGVFGGIIAHLAQWLFTGGTPK